ISRIFWRTSSWYSLMWRSASISCAHRFSMIFTGPLPKMSCWKMSDRLAWGSTENTSTLWPRRANQEAVAAENVVFPSPPLPPNITYRRSGCCSKNAAKEVWPSFGVSSEPAASDSGPWVIPWLLEDGVGNVPLPQHAPLPCGDLRDHERQQPQRVIGRQDGDAQQVTHGDQDEQVLHAGAGPQGLPRHVVGGHPVGDLAELAQEALRPLAFLRLVPIRLFSHASPGAHTPCRS